jgi:hypothetical protein
MNRLRRIRALTVAAARRRSRDVFAAAGVGCIAIGLSTGSIALAWIAVGAFLVFAAGAGQHRGAA